MKEICLPSKNLAIDGTAPEQGDQVDISSLKGKVTRVEGENTYLTPTEINGEPVDEPEAEDNAEEEGLEPNEENIRKEAGKFDDMMGGE